jgi:hypothetical protein
MESIIVQIQDGNGRWQDMTRITPEQADAYLTEPAYPYGILRSGDVARGVDWLSYDVTHGPVTIR